MEAGLGQESSLDYIRIPLRSPSELTRCDMSTSQGRRHTDQQPIAFATLALSCFPHDKRYTSLAGTFPVIRSLYPPIKSSNFIVSKIGFTPCLAAISKLSASSCFVPWFVVTSEMLSMTITAKLNGTGS